MAASGFSKMAPTCGLAASVALWDIIFIYICLGAAKTKNDGLRARRGAQMSSDELIFCSNRPIFSVDIIRTYAPVDAPKRRRRVSENEHVQADHALRADSWSTVHVHFLTHAGLAVICRSYEIE